MRYKDLQLYITLYRFFFINVIKTNKKFKMCTRIAMNLIFMYHAYHVFKCRATCEIYLSNVLFIID